MPDVVRVVEVEGGGDVLVLPAGADLEDEKVKVLLAGAVAVPVDPVQELVRAARLNSYRFERDAAKRRAILAAIHDAMRRRETFSWEEVYQALGDQQGYLALSPTAISKYQAILYHSRAFSFEKDEAEAQARPVLKKRRARLAPGMESLDAFVRSYELGIVRKVVERTHEGVTVERIRDLLGLSTSATGPDERAHWAYCKGLYGDAYRSGRRDCEAADND
jgi:hypothetical protein